MDIHAPAVHSPQQLQPPPAEVPNPDSLPHLLFNAPSQQPALSLPGDDGHTPEMVGVEDDVQCQASREDITGTPAMGQVGLAHCLGYLYGLI